MSEVVFVERRFVQVLVQPWVLCLSFAFLCARAFSISGYTLALCSVLLLGMLPAMLLPQSLPLMLRVTEPGLYLVFFMGALVWGQALHLSGALVPLLQAAVWMLAATLFLYAIISLMMLVFAVLDGVHRLDRILPWGYLNIRYWSHLATWCLPLLPLAVIGLPSKHLRILRGCLYLAGGVWCWLLLLSMGRGSILALVLAAGFIMLVFGRQARQWLCVILVMALLGLLLWLATSFLLPWLLGVEVHVRGVKLSSSGRFTLWQEAWQMSLRHFPFGMGPQSWVLHDAITRDFAAGTRFGHPHNMYLLWAAEYGWWWVVCLATAAALVLRYWLRAIMCLHVKHNQPVLIGVSASVLAAVLHAGVSSVFLMPASMLVGFVVLGLFWALVLNALQPPAKKANMPEPAAVSSFKWSYRLIFVGLLALAATGWQFAVLRHYQVVEAELSQPGLNVLGRGARRFWDNGHVPGYVRAADGSIRPVSR